jgi:hypothetical protein
MVFFGERLINDLCEAVISLSALSGINCADLGLSTGLLSVRYSTNMK